MAPAITSLDALRFLSFGISKKFGLRPSSAHNRSGTEAENLFSVRDCYRRDAAASLRRTRLSPLDVYHVAGGAHIKNL